MIGIETFDTVTVSWWSGGYNRKIEIGNSKIDTEKRARAK